jgi:hypothetical protein
MGMLGITAQALLFTWLLGGFLLRLGGLVLVFAGSIGLAVSANADGVLIAGVGAFVWLLGHGQYALRHGVWKSRLAGWLWCSAGSALGS